MAELIKRVKASQIPETTDIKGFKAFGIRENCDGTIDNVRVPMSLLKGNINIVTLTEDEYETLEIKDPDTFYFIAEE